MRVGNSVRVHSLLSRPDLNGCRGKVSEAFDALAGRVGVLVDGESRPLALRPASLTDLTAEAIDAVLSDEDLVRLVLLHLPRWLRAGVLTGVSASIRRCVLEHPDLYRSIVVVANVEMIPSRVVPTRAALGGQGNYGARQCVEEGALPLLPAHAAAISDKSWVETLLIEPVKDSGLRGPVAAAAARRATSVTCAQLSAVVNAEWPSLTTLLAPGMDKFINMEPTPEAQRVRAMQCRDWVRRHVQRSVLHLHLLGDVYVQYGNNSSILLFDPADQPGLISMQLDNGQVIPPPDFLGELVASWPAAVRAKLRNLDFPSSFYPALDDVVSAFGQGLLPNLRRLRLGIGRPDEDDFNRLALSAANTKIEAIYLHIDSSEDLPIDCLDVFQRVSTLQELVVACDSCTWTPAGCDECHVTQHLRSRLGNVALVICDVTDISEALDSLHRAFLPSAAEEWHRSSCSNLAMGTLMGPMRRLAETLPFLRGRRGQARMELPDEVWDAAAKGDSLTTMAWLHTGGHADARLDDEDGAGGTLLLCAASGGRLPLVDMLLRHGASLDLQNYIGWTALMGAAFEGSVEVVRRLLECGANPNKQNTNGNTARTIAQQRLSSTPPGNRQRRYAEVVRLLCEAGSVTPAGLDLLELLVAQFPEHCVVHRSE